MARSWKLGVFVVALATGMELLAIAPARADLVVVRAVGGSLKAGQTLATGASLTLPAGASATLLSQDGKTIALKGPFSGIPETKTASDGDSKVVATLARLLTTGSSDTASLGVTRGMHIRDPYAIDQNGGAHCQVANMPAVFKRELALGEARVTITNGAGTESAAIWADGAETASWPNDLPLLDGNYMVRSESHRNPVKLTIHRVPTEIKDPAALAAWMADHGCRGQAIALLNSLK